MTAMYRFAVVVLAVGLLIPASADDDPIDEPIYESLEDIVIGRVFFTAARRAKIDRRRNGDTSTADAHVRRVRTESDDTDAAGFIINGDGDKKVYLDGEFVDVDE